MIKDSVDFASQELINKILIASKYGIFFVALFAILLSLVIFSCNLSKITSQIRYNKVSIFKIIYYFTFSLIQIFIVLKISINENDLITNYVSYFIAKLFWNFISLFLIATILTVKAIKLFKNRFFAFTIRLVYFICISIYATPLTIDGIIVPIYGVGINNDIIMLFGTQFIFSMLPFIIAGSIAALIGLIIVVYSYLWLKKYFIKSILKLMKQFNKIGNNLNFSSTIINYLIKSYYNDVIFFSNFFGKFNNNLDSLFLDEEILLFLNNLNKELIIDIQNGLQIFVESEIILKATSITINGWRQVLLN